MLCHPLAARAAEPPAPSAPPAATPPGVTQSAAPTASPPAAAQGAASAPTSPNSAPKPFDILEYDVEGNTLLPVIEIEKAVTPFLGPGRSIKDIEGARGRLERIYHDRGYKTVLVDIPQQQIADGVVRLRVLEAPVGKLSIKGSRYHSLEVMRDKMQQLDPGSVPNFNEVQKELGDVNRSADLRVTPVLKASETPGHVDVDLQVEDHLPLHALVEVDNRYSANTTHPRVIGEVHYDNLFQSNQSLSLQYQTAPLRTSDAKVGSLSYVIPTESGPVWALYAVYSDSNVAAVGNLNVIGKGNIFGLRFIDPLPTSSRDFYNSLTLGVDWKDFKQTVVLEGATSDIQSPVSYPPFTVEYTGTWLGPAPAQGAGRAAIGGSRSSTTLDVTLEFLVQGLGTNWREFANKRAHASASYAYLHPSVTREQVLPGQWSAVLRVDGQIASGPLINNEQFAAGGADSVRGYVEAERLGDEALHGSLELRTPQLFQTRSWHFDQSYLFLFVDGARLRVLEPLPAQEDYFSLSSAGVGLRFKTGGFYVALDGARILTDGAVTRAGRYRGLFKVTYSH